MRKLKSHLSRIVLRFRHWIIKKLGGFTEQQSITNAVIYSTLQFDPVKLMAKTEIDKRMIFELGEERAFAHVIRDLACGMLDTLIKNRLLLIDCCDSYKTERRVYTARLYLVPPKVVSMSEGPLTLNRK